MQSLTLAYVVLNTQSFGTCLCHLLCRLGSIATHRDHFVRRLSVRPSVCLSFRLSHSHCYVSQATHAFLGMLPLFLKVNVCPYLKPNFYLCMYYQYFEKWFIHFKENACIFLLFLAVMRKVKCLHYFFGTLICKLFMLIWLVHLNWQLGPEEIWS